jgi:hypothetical protein
MGNDGLNSTVVERACAARILVAITVHFNTDRLKFLAEVLRSLADFPVATMDIILVTNTVVADEVALLNRLCDEILPGKGASIRGYENLGHPFHLTWCHRTIIADEFTSENDSQYTHFIYLEDDIDLNFRNFCYFLEYREILRDTGLIPSFLRVEYSTVLNGFVNTDNEQPIDLLDQPHIEVGDDVLVNIPNPYTACYILDLPLAAEFLRTRSFHRERSRAVTDWDVRERAAMGLCFENVPDSFRCRFVVPVARRASMALDQAWVAHLPNNYANDPNSRQAKIRMDSLFLNMRELASCNRQAATGHASQRVESGNGDSHNRRHWRSNSPYLNLPRKVIEGLRWRLGLRR